MLCELAHNFPPFVAAFLERERKLPSKRKFREETVTDMLMASLVGLEGFGIAVDFPDEPATGGDMDWIYAAPKQIKGGKYLRLLIQAKRAYFQRSIHDPNGGYWYYHHLDHGAPKGQQAQTLVAAAAAQPGTLALYAFYHPLSALKADQGLPVVEGVNLHEAAPIAAMLARKAKYGEGRKRKKLDTWRPGFMPLSDLLCWTIVLSPEPDQGDPTRTRFLIGSPPAMALRPEIDFHPERVAMRLKERRAKRAPGGDRDSVEIAPATEIPPEITRAILRKTTSADREQLERPRVVLWTNLTQTDSGAFVSDDAG